MKTFLLLASALVVSAQDIKVGSMTPVHIYCNTNIVLRGKGTALLIDKRGTAKNAVVSCPGWKSNVDVLPIRVVLTNNVLKVTDDLP